MVVIEMIGPKMSLSANGDPKLRAFFNWYKWYVCACARIHSVRNIHIYSPQKQTSNKVNTKHLFQNMAYIKVMFWNKPLNARALTFYTSCPHYTVGLLNE